MENTFFLSVLAPSEFIYNTKLILCFVLICRLAVETKKAEAVKHALAVHAAVNSGNYVLFFRLYKTAPNLNTCLMGALHIIICTANFCKSVRE